MDNSKEFNLMLARAINSEPLDFQDFDRTKNVQDQLQEMVIPDDEKDCLNKYVVWLDEFQDWVLNDCTGLEWSHLHMVTREQLELAFVMKEKYNKVWVNNEWRNGS